HVAAGVPGTTSNLPETAPKPATTPSTAGTSRKTENVNHQTSRLVKRTVLPRGSVKKLSVSVLIDHDIHWEGTGANAKRVLVAPSRDRMKGIHDLAAAATGIDMARGDQLIVESLPFESTLNSDPPGLPETLAAKKVTPMDRLKDPKIM